MKKSYKILIVLSFIPLWIVLLMGLGMLPMWLEAVYQLLTGDIPEGNPDQITYSAALPPAIIVVLGVIGSFGLFNFLAGSSQNMSISWRNPKVFYFFVISGITPCVWLTYNQIPGVLSWLEAIFILVVPISFVIFAYKLRSGVKQGE